MEASEQSQGKWQVPFFTIWTGQAFSLIGSKVAQFALVWWLTQLTGSATVLATASMVALIPEIALGPIAGAYVTEMAVRYTLADIKTRNWRDEAKISVFRGVC